MNYEQIKVLLIARLGNRTDLEGSIEAELAIAQENLEQSWSDMTMPWFLQKEGVITIPAGEDSVALPADFLREHDDGLHRYQEAGGDAMPMDKLFPENLAAEEYGEAYGCINQKPYAVAGTTLTVYPAAVAEATITLSYFGAEAALSSETYENKWSRYAPELLIAVTGRKLASYIRDAELTQIFTADADVESTRLIRASEMRNTANIKMEIV